MVDTMMTDAETQALTQAADYQPHSPVMPPPPPMPQLLRQDPRQDIRQDPRQQETLEALRAMAVASATAAVAASADKSDKSDGGASSNGAAQVAPQESKRKSKAKASSPAVPEGVTDTALTSTGRAGPRSVESTARVGLETSVGLNGRALTHLAARVKGREPLCFDVHVKCSNIKCLLHAGVAGTEGRYELNRHLAWAAKQSEELAKREDSEAWEEVMDARSVKRVCHLCYPGLPKEPPKDCSTLCVTLWLGKVVGDEHTGERKLVSQRDKTETQVEKDDQGKEISRKTRRVGLGSAVFLEWATVQSDILRLFRGITIESTQVRRVDKDGKERLSNKTKIWASTKDVAGRRLAEIAASPNKKAANATTKTSRFFTVKKDLEALRWSYVLATFPDLFLSAMYHHGSWAEAVDKAFSLTRDGKVVHPLRVVDLYGPLLDPRGKEPADLKKELARKKESKERHASAKKRKAEEEKAGDDPSAATGAASSAAAGVSVPSAAVAAAASGVRASSAPAPKKQKAEGATTARSDPEEEEDDAKGEVQGDAEMESAANSDSAGSDSEDDDE
jgi:hypothetical protein